MEVIEDDDLQMFANLALGRLEAIYDRAKVAGLYRDRLIMLALSQGGALHYINQKNGLKDIDVWAFYLGGLDKPFPVRAVWNADLGVTKFGKHPDDIHFSGRRMDVIGRSVEVRPDDNLVAPVSRWLQGYTRSAWSLRQKAIVAINPEQVRGQVLLNHFDGKTDWY